MAGHADEINVAGDRFGNRFFRCLEQRSDQHVEAEVGERCSDHPGAPIMAVLTHLGDEHLGGTAELVGERGDVGGDRCVTLVAVVGGTVHTRDQLGLSPMSFENSLERVAHFANGGSLSGCSDTCCKQVAVAHGGGCQRCERRFGGFGVALRACFFESPHLLLPDVGVVDVEHIDHLRIGDLVLVDTNHDIFVPVDTRLFACSSFLDTQLRPTIGDRLGHTASFFDLCDECAGTIGEIGCELLDVVATGKRIDGTGHAGLFGENQLGVASKTSAELGRQTKCLVETIGVQRLCATKHRG